MRDFWLGSSLTGPRSLTGLTTLLTLRNTGAEKRSTAARWLCWYVFRNLVNPKENHTKILVDQCS